MFAHFKAVLLINFLILGVSSGDVFAQLGNTHSDSAPRPPGSSPQPPNELGQSRMGRLVSDPGGTAFSLCEKYAASPFTEGGGRNGAGVALGDIDFSRAIPACEEAVRRNPNEKYLKHVLGRAYWAAKNYNQAVVWTQRAAEQGFSLSQHNMGLFYQEGLGVSKDFSQALAWYRKAADQGFGLSQAVIGYFYLNGLGVPKDEVQALSWYRKAADQGVRDPQLEILNKKTNQEAINKIPQRDPTDVVAQVLNYSDSGDDQPKSEYAWRRDGAGKCRYIKPRVYSETNRSDLEEKSIDLDEIDPRLIKFGYQVNGYGQTTTDTTYDSKALLRASNELDLERLQRGWTLIYSKYCRGKQKAF